MACIFLFLCILIISDCILNIVLLHYEDSGFYYILMKRFIVGGWLLFVLVFALPSNYLGWTKTTNPGCRAKHLNSWLIILSLARLLRVCPMHACLRRFGQSFYTEFEAFSFWLCYFWNSLFTFLVAVEVPKSVSERLHAFCWSFSHSAWHWPQPATRLNSKLRNTSMSFPLSHISALLQNLPIFCLSTVPSGNCFYILSGAYSFSQENWSSRS